MHQKQVSCKLCVAGVAKNPSSAIFHFTMLHVVSHLKLDVCQACTCLHAGIEDLREKREEVQKQIRDEENEKAKLQQDLQMLTKRLAHINDGLARKVRTVAE